MTVLSRLLRDAALEELGALLAVQDARPGEAHLSLRKPDCPVCSGRYTPGDCYRPHTFADDCWCAVNPDGDKILERCRWAEAKEW